MRRLLSKSPDETRRLAADMAARCVPGTVIALHGDLGAGKTCFVQGLAAGLGVPDTVNSPTYTLIHEYTSGRIPLYHMDLYRIQCESEALDIGLEDCMYGGGVTVIEWPERMLHLLPDQAVHVIIRAGAADHERWITYEEEQP